MIMLNLRDINVNRVLLSITDEILYYHDRLWDTTKTKNLMY